MAANFAQAPQRTAPAPSRIQTFLVDVRDALLSPLTVFTSAPARFVAASLAAVFIAFTGWSGAWFYGARTAQTAIAGWIANEAQAGRSYECSSSSVGGFPYRLELRCVEPSAKIAYEQSIYNAGAKDIRAVASILQPKTLTIEITGPVSISEHNQPMLLGSWTRAQITLDRRPSELANFSAKLDGAQFYRATKASMDALMSGDSLEVSIRQQASSSEDGGPAYEIVAHVAGGSVAKVETLAAEPFNADVTAVLQDVRNTMPKTLSARLREWQAGGGRLELKSVRVQQGDAVANVQGAIRLTDNGRIEGALNMATAGRYVQLAQALARDIQPSEAAKIAQQVGARSQTRAIGQSGERQPMPQPTERGRSLSPSVSPPAPLGGGPAGAPHPPQLAPSAQPARPSELPVRIFDGAVYLGPALLGEIPSLFGVR